MNIQQKKARFQELGLRIKIMRARQQGRVDLASMEALRTMSSQAARSVSKDREALTEEIDQAYQLSSMLVSEATIIERSLNKVLQNYSHPFEIDGERFDDELFTLVGDIRQIARRLQDKRNLITQEREQLHQFAEPTIDSVNAIVLTGKLSVQENHELINMVNEHHDLKEELGLR